MFAQSHTAINSLCLYLWRIRYQGLAICVMATQYKTFSLKRLFMLVNIEPGLENDDIHITFLNSRHSEDALEYSFDV